MAMGTPQGNRPFANQLSGECGDDREELAKTAGKRPAKLAGEKSVPLRRSHCSRSPRLSYIVHLELQA